MPPLAADWIEVGDDAKLYSLTHFSIPSHYQSDVSSILLPHGIILDRVERLAEDIVADYNRECSNKGYEGIALICVLKGGHQFFADLLSYIKRFNKAAGVSIPISLDFIKIRSYLNDSSTGNVKIQAESGTLDELSQRFRNQKVIIVEDIVDTGRTMTAFLKKLNEHGLTDNVKVASLFLKRTPLSCGYVPDYVGFSIPDKFIVGYCLDFNEHFRDLDHVCIISDTGLGRYKSK